MSNASIETTHRRNAISRNVHGRAHPRVSVVMPTFNRSGLLKDTAKMILDQSLRDLEFIIIDDISTDDTATVAKELMDTDGRVQYARLPMKGGVTGALNEGIRRASGDYIQVCHDHDIYTPTLTEKMAHVLDAHPSVVFVHPGRQGCDHLGNPLSAHRFVCGYPEVTPGAIWRRRMLTRLASPVTGLSMIRKAAIDRVGPFDPEFGACSDIDMWLRLCAIGDVGYVNELLLFVRGREPGHPYGRMNWAIQDQVIRAHRKHLPLCYQGSQYLYWKARRELEIDVTLLVSYLNCYRHRWWEDVASGRRYLRKRGPLLSRLAGWLL